LFIWTDCDREGENIGSEIEKAARKGNAQIQVKRAQFNNLERKYPCLWSVWTNIVTLYMRLSIRFLWITDRPQQ